MPLAGGRVGARRRCCQDAHDEVALASATCESLPLEGWIDGRRACARPATRRGKPPVLHNCTGPHRGKLPFPGRPPLWPRVGQPTKSTCNHRGRRGPLEAHRSGRTPTPQTKENAESQSQYYVIGELNKGFSCYKF